MTNECEKMSPKDIDDMDASDLYADREQSTETWYSWFVVAIALIGHVLYYGVSWTVGVYYIIFLEAFDQPAWATSFIGSINTASLYFLAPVGACLISRYSCRALVIVGTLTMAAGLLASFWATNIYVLYVTFGLMAGGGAGIGYIPLITIVTQYFDRHRAAAVGVATSGVGFGLLIMPAAINLLKDSFGWRGSLIVISAMMVQFIVLAATLRPTHSPEDVEIADKLHDIGKQDKSFAETMHLDIFKEKRYLLLCLNNALLMYGISVVFVHMAAYGMIVGVHDSACLFTALGVATCVGRITFGLIGLSKRVDIVLIYCLSLLGAGLPIVLLPHATSKWTMIVIASIFGFGTSIIGPYLPQLNCIFLGIRRMPIGYGYLLVFEGIGTLLGAPSAGTLYDTTQLYDYSFYVGGCAVLLSGLVLLPASRWIEPSSIRDEIILEERSQLSLYGYDEAAMEKSIRERMHGRSLLTLYQSHDVLAASLSRIASRQDLNRSRSHFSSSMSLHNSRLSIPRHMFSSKLTLHSAQINAQEAVPIVEPHHVV